MLLLDLDRGSRDTLAVRQRHCVSHLGKITRSLYETEWTCLALYVCYYHAVTCVEVSSHARIALLSFFFRDSPDCGPERLRT
jgi:hypothetical protein